MGSGSSTLGAPTQRFKRDNIRDRNKLVRCVEKFILCVYTSYSRIDAVWYILGCTGGLNAFGLFVESERASEYFTLFKEINKVRQVHKPTLFVLRKYLKSILHDYIANDSPSQINISPTLKRDMEALMTEEIEQYHDPTGRIFELILQLQIETVNLMAREQFNRFLSSKFYKNWRANDRGRALALTSDHASINVLQYTNLHPDSIRARSITERKHSLLSLHQGAKVKRERPTKKQFCAYPVVIPEDSMSSAFAHVDARELRKILDLQSWFSALLSAVEILPLAFSISKVIPKNRRGGFPLIYANKYFEVTMGYTRSSVLGWACKDFLQDQETEKECIQKITEALKNQEPTSVILTNKNADNRNFKQLLVLKPVFDGNGIYTYVMAMHCEASDDDVLDPLQMKLKSMEDMMSILPDKIIMEQNDEEENSWMSSLGINHNNNKSIKSSNNNKSNNSNTSKTNISQQPQQSSPRLKSDMIQLATQTTANTTMNASTTNSYNIKTTITNIINNSENDSKSGSLTTSSSSAGFDAAVFIDKIEQFSAKYKD